MKLIKKEIKSFLETASVLKSRNNILPILDYLKFENGMVTKNILNSFIAYNITYNGPAFLIEERILNNFIKGCHAEEFDVVIKGKNITLIAEGAPTMKSEQRGLEEYPVFDWPDSVEVDLTEDIVNGISVAVKFIESDGLQPAYNFLYIGNGGVRGSNGFIGYSSPAPELSCGNIYIDKVVALAISRLGRCKYNANEKYHFIKAEGIQLGFIKNEYKYIDISSFFILPSEDYSVFNASDLIAFNSMAIANAVLKDTTAVMNIREGKVLMEVKDNDYNTEQTQEFDIEGGYESKFSFNPVLMNRMLKAFEEERLRFYVGKGNMYFTSDEGKWTALIMQRI